MIIHGILSHYQFGAHGYYSGIILVVFLLPFSLPVFHKEKLLYVVVSQKYRLYQALS